jgi:ubiquitin-conjugating enzyme E2 W
MSDLLSNVLASPIVTFIPSYTPPPPSTTSYSFPIHPHIYSNGHICASILGSEWSPVLTVSTVCLTLQSMLASCKKKEPPQDNERYVRNAPDNPKKVSHHSSLSYPFTHDSRYHRLDSITMVRQRESRL